MHKNILILVVLILISSPAFGQNIVTNEAGSTNFPVVSNQKATSIFVSSDDQFLVQKAAQFLQGDVQKVSGQKPAIIDKLPAKASNLIIVGSVDSSAIIRQMVDGGKLDVSDVKGKWETYKIQVVDHPFDGIDQALVIVGSDRRGTAYGALTLSRQMGVSPWYWWADVPVKTRKEIYVKKGSYLYGPPAVKYRGIFINDEAPALSGWVQEKFGGFNHQFYEKIFELMLRERANYLWPAMWGRAFNVDDTLNPVVADKYGIVMGTSHHEPLMRAQAEWNAKPNHGAWNYQTNDSTLREFWRKGIKRMDDRESIVTIGMRGNGDKPMSDSANISLLEKIVHDQRQIIENVTGKDASKTPQIWALYKEVQEYYDRGMRVPKDVTLLFSDDNWGDIRRLPELKDSTRSGGYGVYYHFDYVGGPRSYKWINTNALPKIWQQMKLAYDYHARRIWIVNVGDLKPMEFPMSFFLDYAWNPNEWPAEELPDYTKQWAGDQFGEKFAGEIARILTKYTKFNSRRKPSLLSADTYSLTHYREFERVTENYDQLAQKAKEIYQQLPKNYQVAYYQLVLYPVKASANLYDMYLALAKNRRYAEQGRAATNEMAAKVKTYFQKDAELANYYNTKMVGGKWNHMMDQSNIGYTSWSDPKQDIMPRVDSVDVQPEAEMGVAIEGSRQWWPESDSSATLSTFSKFGKDSSYIEIFNRGQTPFQYNISSKVSWLNISKKEGKIDLQKRIWLSVNWEKAPIGNQTVPITISGTGKTVEVQVIIHNSKKEGLDGFVESNDYVSMEAAHFSKAVNSDSVHWKVIPNLGRTLSGVAALPFTVSPENPGENAPHLEYKMYLQDAGNILVHVYMSPTLDVQGNGGLRYAVSIDDQKPKIDTLDINKNQRNWGEAVSRNIAEMKTNLQVNKPGQHTLKFWWIDPGVVLQKLVFDTGGLKSSYLGPPESFYKK